VRANRYRRGIELGADVDTARVDAGPRDGVLAPRIARLELAKPRRIDVRVESAQARGARAMRRGRLRSPAPG
jgi:hypothetical protein